MHKALASIPITEKTNSIKCFLKALKKQQSANNTCLFNSESHLNTLSKPNPLLHVGDTVRSPIIITW
jgi:hypothetical protein